MDVPDTLVERFSDEISEVSEDEFRDFPKERKFIKSLLETLDDIYITEGNSRLWTKTKYYDRSPEVGYYCEDTDDLERMEFADLLFVIHHLEDTQLDETRVSISQSKYAGEDDNGKFDACWDIRLDQYHLLEELPPFTLTSPDLSKCYWLNPDNNSFSTYSFASDSWLPFFDSTEAMRRHMTYGGQCSGSEDYDRDGTKVSGYNSAMGFLRLLVRGQRGEPLSDNPVAAKFFQHVFEESDSFGRSSSPNVISDGGEPEGEPVEPAEGGNGFGIIQITVSRGRQSEFDEEGPPVFFDLEEQ